MYVRNKFLKKILKFFGLYRRSFAEMLEEDFGGNKEAFIVANKIVEDEEYYNASAKILKAVGLEEDI